MDVTVIAGQRRFGQYPGNCLPGVGIATARASYMDGYKTGSDWKVEWMPGGPSITKFQKWETNKTDAEDWEAFCVATEENYHEWHRGFRDGLYKQEPNYPPANDHKHILGYN